MKRGKPLQRRTRLAPQSAKAVASDAVLAEAREARRRLTNGWCEGDTPACRPGAHQGHHAHHVRRRSQGGAHQVDNLRWLCWPGHEWVHAHPAMARKMALLG